MILNQCPNEEVMCKYTNTKSSTSNEEVHYKTKDLSDYLGIKDGVSPTLANCIKVLEDLALEARSSRRPRRPRRNWKFKKLAQEIIKETRVDE